MPFQSDADKNTERTSGASTPALKISNLSKCYVAGSKALDNINLSIPSGEIFALLGQNGAGKTTLINTICGIVKPTEGRICIAGHDLQNQYRAARSLIGLVPQEFGVDAFMTVSATVALSRGLFGKAPNRPHIERVLRSLSLWEKRDAKIMTLSGGMKRRVMIAKALAHEPRLLFLDEPTAGVDVALRDDTWRLVSSLRDQGVTILLTTHYLDEAERIADRIGIIQRGKFLLTADKNVLMRRFGKKKLTIQLEQQISEIPSQLTKFSLQIDSLGWALVYTYDESNEDNRFFDLMDMLRMSRIGVKDFSTSQSSLEDIFLSLTSRPSNSSISVC
ncbi:ABC transporter ATP-binding protein [Paraburkholderia tropica]|nr:ABC transporter ATP-binding protein [Paraburkholderia tropica]RQN37341.1 ABC transporter ATP-binding protein [Paraburkholderia tropica]